MRSSVWGATILSYSQITNNKTYPNSNDSSLVVPSRRSCRKTSNASNHCVVPPRARKNEVTIGLSWQAARYLQQEWKQHKFTVEGQDSINPQMRFHLKPSHVKQVPSDPEIFPNKSCCTSKSTNKHIHSPIQCPQARERCRSGRPPALQHEMQSVLPLCRLCRGEHPWAVDGGDGLWPSQASIPARSNLAILTSWCDS